MYLGKLIVLCIVLINTKVTNSLWGFGHKTSSPNWYCDNTTLVSEEVWQCSHYDCPGYIYCARKKWCIFSVDLTLDTNIHEIDLVIIEHSKYVPRCFIMNLPKLKTIYGMNKNIADLESWAFWNLPELKVINLSYNLIRTLQYGTFSELSSVESLDLSWNEITYIGRGTFQGMRNLKKLDLSRNYISHFDISYCFFIRNSIHDNSTMPLEEMNLSYNRVEKVYNLKYFSQLNVVDLSHNSLVDMDFKNNFHESQWLTKLDISDNMIFQLFIDYSNMYIERFRMAFNRVKHAYDLNLSANINFITLDGNPWKCEEYNDVLKKIYKKKITILNPDEDEELYFATRQERKNYPVCWASEDRIIHFGHMQTAYKREKNVPCETMSRCPGNMICKSGRCWDPCKYDICDKSAICVNQYNGFYCDCRKGKVRDPFIEYTKCYNLDCFIKSDCTLRYGAAIEYECKNHVCVKPVSERK